MQLIETIWEFIQHNGLLTVISAITLIQVSPLKIDPWSKLGKWIRGIIYGDVERKLDSIKGMVTKVENRMDEEKATQARNHILRFADELYEGRHHSQEYFLQLIDEIKIYEEYCKEHPDFPNGRTLQACAKIRETFDDLWKEHKF